MRIGGVDRKLTIEMFHNDYSDMNIHLGKVNSRIIADQINYRRYLFVNVFFNVIIHGI